ncbi:hypothetical protein [Slackia heliotrinireducens]|uniref:hypothetical protein n=1 Tax=Slackia heliotrinireducens TaxID=84110 RepID=UPI00331528EA
MSMTSVNGNDFFKMGALVAVGELFDMGMLGSSDDQRTEVRHFIRSFGVDSIEDVEGLGITGPYLADFVKVFE